MELGEKNNYRPRAPRKRLQVIFPDGVEYCYTNATVTFVESLKKIGVQNVLKANLQLCHLPLVSKTVYEGLEEYMKPLDEGWWVNVQSDTAQKYLQLRAIHDNLNIDFDVNLLSIDVVKAQSVKKGKRTVRVDTFYVMFPDKTLVTGLSDQERFLNVIDRIGPENFFYRSFMSGNKELITRYRKFNNQLHSLVQRGFWITIPSSVKDKVRVLEQINEKMKLGLEIVLPGDYEYLKLVLSTVLGIDVSL